ncbi:glycosyl hydrolase family 28-related protein [Pantoea sp.]|uniref:glycosyl hydrolase family 28-related protein n=1 Tax=Pantoea sp. TaxID=69393 RepID=UPI00289A7D9A|nr:glycosyl hydrolase family 28-related protein [Pantoea sp.]
MSLLRVDQLSPVDDSVVIQVADLVDKSTGLSSSIVNMPSPDSRSLAEWSFDFVSVKKYGAKGDGVSDDTEAIQEALDKEEKVYFPPGIYICGGAISTNDAVVIQGAGITFTELRFTGSTKGLQVNLSSSYKAFNISDLSITTTGVPADKHSALTVNGVAQFSGSADSLGRNILGNRTMKRGSIQRVDVRGVNVSTQAWGFGYKLTSVMNFHMSDISYSGLNGSTPYSGRAIVINGDGIPVDVSITRFWIYFAEMAIYAPDYVEGVHLSDFELVNVTYGIYAGFYSSTESVVPSGATGALAFYIENGHINCRAMGVNLNNTNQDKIHDLLIYTTPTSSDSVGYGVRLVGGSNNKVHDIHVELSNAANATSSNRGVLLEGISYSSIHDISVNGLCQSALTITGDSQNNVINGITGNNINYVIDEISGSNNNNQIGPNMGESYNTLQYYLPVSTANRINYQKVYYTGTLSVASGIGTLTITPPRTLSARPPTVNVTMQYSTTNTLTGYYDYDNSTPSSLLIRVRSSDVANAQTIRVCVEYPLT